MAKTLKTDVPDDLFSKIRQTSIREIAHKMRDCRADGTKKAEETRFAVFLGAGASVSAGIKTASEMMDEFREKIIQRDSPLLTKKTEQTKWLKENVLNKGIGNEYSKLFENFERTPRGRQNYISKLLKGKEPTFGYAMLASLIARGYVKTVLTTNFDDLVFTGCTKFTGIRPVIYAYGIMATEMKFSSPHTKILKMHGDYLYSALANTEAEMSLFNQDPNMKVQVTSALDEYELVVFGYSGNDVSVMNILKNYPPNKELYWCYRTGSRPSDRVLELIHEKDGSLVPIEGFDEAMYELYKIIDFELDEVLASYEERRKEILKYIDEFKNKYPTSIVSEGTISDSKRKELKSKKTESLDDWIELSIAGNEAVVRKEYAKAEKSYKAAWELNGTDFATNYNFGMFLAEHGQNPKEAKEFLDSSLALMAKIPEDSIDGYKMDIGMGYVFIGDYASALAIFDTINETQSYYYVYALVLRAAIAKRLGKKAEATRIAKLALKVTKDPYDTACAYASLGDFDKAFENLEEALASDPSVLSRAGMSFSLSVLKQDPRFQKYVAAGSEETQNNLPPHSAKDTKELEPNDNK